MELKQKLYIAYSAYGPASKVNITTWLAIRDMKRNDQDFKKKYNAMRIR